jgi:hypothetical protein
MYSNMGGSEGRDLSEISHHRKTHTSLSYLCAEAKIFLLQSRIGYLSLETRKSQVRGWREVDNWY